MLSSRFDLEDLGMSCRPPAGLGISSAWLLQTSIIGPLGTSALKAKKPTNSWQATTLDKDNQAARPAVEAARLVLTMTIAAIACECYRLSTPYTCPGWPADTRFILLYETEGRTRCTIDGCSSTW